jgi:hypothetical protein
MARYIKKNNPKKKKDQLKASVHRHVYKKKDGSTSTDYTYKNDGHPFLEETVDDYRGKKVERGQRKVVAKDSKLAYPLKNKPKGTMRQVSVEKDSSGKVKSIKKRPYK